MAKQRRQAGQRRYPDQDKYPIYNDHWDFLMKKSEIFNGGEMIPNVNSICFDETNIEYLIQTYVGDDDGFFKREKSYVMAHLPRIEADLEDLENKFQEFKTARVNQGFPEPTEYPKDMLTQKYKLEAEYDVREKELLELQKLLKVFTDREEEVDESRLLKYGLKEAVKLLGGVVAEIDGQPVEKLKKLLVISKGPYKGLSVEDYRKLAKVWKAARVEADKERLKEAQTKAKELGLPIPQQISPSSGTVSKNSLPPYPDWAVNHYETTDNEGSDK